MPLLDTHLEQIALSSTAIAELPFPPPKIFTNALLHTPDITSLIRDTEPHERRLFTSSQPPRQSTLHNSTLPSTTLPHQTLRQTSAISTLLGPDLASQIRTEAQSGRDTLDVEVLLKGAERLCQIYPVAGAQERIGALRSRHERLEGSIGRYEERVERQMGVLERMNRQREGEEDEGEGEVEEGGMGGGGREVTEEDLQREDEEIRELERKKKGLEERVSGMERDLGGLLR